MHITIHIKLSTAAMLGASRRGLGGFPELVVAALHGGCGKHIHDTLHTDLIVSGTRLEIERGGLTLSVLLLLHDDTA